MTYTGPASSSLRAPLSKMVMTLGLVGLVALSGLSCFSGAQAVTPPPPPPIQVAVAPPPPPPPEPVVAPAPPPPPEETPLLPDMAQAFRAIPEDRPPAHIVRGIHYVVSNENRHYLYKPAAREPGGVFIGVGTDQNYLIAGWYRPEVLVLMDFDQVVVDLHRVYKLAFLDAESPAAFVKLWSPTRVRRLHALIDQSDEAPAVRRRMHYALNVSRHRVERRLFALKYRYQQVKVPSFVTDAAQYAYVVGMFKHDRVFMMRGDLTADKSVNGIAAVARTYNLPVRVVYLSNAERYFPYNPDFRASMLNLPMDEHTMVLRTSDFHDGHYQYTAQSGANFHAWLRSPDTRSVKRMLDYRHYRQKNGLAQILVTPDAVPHLAQAARRTVASVRLHRGDRVLGVQAQNATPAAAPAAPAAPTAVSAAAPPAPTSAP